MRSKKPLAAMLSIMLIAISEIAFMSKTENLTGLPLFQPTADDATVVAKHSFISLSADKLVLIGDSSCMMGLNPVVMSEHSLDAINLGTLSSMTLEGFACLAEEALEIMPQPKAIVLAVLPRAFTVTETRAREFNLLPRYLVAYGKTSDQIAITPRDRWSAFTSKHVFNIFPPEFYGSYAAFEQALCEKKGHLPEGKIYTGTKEPVSAFEATDFARRAIHRLSVAAEARKVPLYLWISPTPADAVTEDYENKANAFLSELKKTEPSLRQVHDKMPLWPTDRFGTVTHLNPASAKTQSEEFANYFSRIY